MGFASVTLNDNGTGWVGKGDVQLAFGWNNAAAQKYAKDVTFSFEQSSSYEAVCVWVTEGKKESTTHTRTHKRKVSVASTITYDVRKTGQYTGYILTGFGETTGEGDEVPVVGGPCPGNQGNEGVWESVIETSSSLGGLFVTFQGNSVALPETPPPETAL